MTGAVNCRLTTFDEHYGAQSCHLVCAAIAVLCAFRTTSQSVDPGYPAPGSVPRY